MQLLVNFRKKNHQYVVVDHLKFIKHKFYIRDVIKRFTCFILPPK